MAPSAHLVRRLICLPTKTKWRASSSSELIARSADELVQLVKECGVNPPPVVLMSRLGCGNGGLSWATVRPLLAKRLVEDLYVVVSQ